MAKANQPEDAFKFVDIPEDANANICWPWTGSVGGSDGRGYFSTKGVKWLAYRLIYTLVYGPIPDGLVIRHKCDNKLCCNPTHLEPGTQSENENDKYDRDRYGFPLQAIRAIMKYHKLGTLSQKQIADIVTAECGVEVTQQRVSDITTGKRRARQVDAINQEEEDNDE